MQLHVIPLPLILIAGVFATFCLPAPEAVAANPEQPAATSLRQTLSLDGVWQIAEGKMDVVPLEFTHTVPVPGLVDLANPPFLEPGPKVQDRNQIKQKDPRRDAFWYRRTFTVKGPLPSVARLKVSKAMFGTRVFLNGQSLGDHAPCFTPGYFPAGAALKAGENELLIRVGADRDTATEAVPSGFDFEKQRYIPGIFDSVQLILAGTPYIQNVQVAPEPTNRQARVRLWLEGAAGADVNVEVREARSGKLAGSVSAHLASAPQQVVDVTVPVADCHLWSPEDPFLYALSARTTGDGCTTRFGMREFRFDPATGQARLNGKPYFLRGSNFTLYRFFEDSECGALPWNAQWVRELHQRVKDMHWNSLRYCIGFPPEAWYDVADEEGILIQDEFPIWFGGRGWSKWPAGLKREELAVEYAEWMRERWNHPCVAIWDANNETTSSETGPAIQQVRGLDLSGRPWDNSYGAPQEPGDSLESHPYHFQNPAYKLAMLAQADPVPSGNENRNDGKHAAIINEYGWLWLNRDGTPTTLTAQLFQNLLGPQSTTAQRRHLYATYLAAESEFWRAGRKAAAVMHFTTLGYARPDGQTSDHWLPGGVAKLEWEPEFYRYVRDAFAPVGLMLGFWNESAPAGAEATLPVTLINDLETPWSGPVTVRLKRGNQVVAEQKQEARLEAFGTTRLSFKLPWPAAGGPCVLEAELVGADGKPVQSVRDLTIR